MQGKHGGGNGHQLTRKLEQKRQPNKRLGKTSDQSYCSRQAISQTKD